MTKVVQYKYMFGTQHILYMVISFLLSVGLLVLFYFFVKTDRGKKAVLVIFAVLTVAIHFSSLWVDFFSTGSAEVESVMLLPIHPCNVIMWLLLICSLIKKRENNIAYKLLTEFTFYAGVVCGIIGIVLNENFAATPDLTDWYSLKGLLSHSTMIIGCAYLLVGGYIKIRMFNVLSTAAGLGLFLVIGGIINGLYAIFKLSPCNSMYLLEVPFPQAPWFNTFMIGLMALVLVFVICAIYELIALKKEDRWYQIFKKNKGEIK